jgi:hypothetical protein
MLTRAIAATALVVSAATVMILSGGRPEPSPQRTPGAFYLRLSLHIDGKLQGYQYWARNGEGWIAHAQGNPGQQPVSRELLDGNGTVVLINELIRARSTFDRVERGLDPFGTPASGCTLTSEGRKMSGLPVGETRMDGLRAIVFQKMNGTEERWTDWVTPDLGCVVLRSVTEYRGKADGTWRIVRHLTTSQLEIGAYPAWLFVLTLDYREMSPMAVLRELGDTHAGVRLESVESSYRTNVARKRDPVYGDSPSPAPAASQ